ncbi:hypothetical protein QVD17_04185 [Tagetes erecta]|uniref:Uncharacterized protein n=1 Tax=Tagetes erecta TaxID=13708 RepID=A0AAD8PAJ5_TARER|nr:hypothetical protein QVD17_04185 [Tagetes erecta]
MEFFSIFAEELISHQPSPFANLKRLKIYPARVTLEDETQPKVFISPEVKNYLLDSSPSATFTMVSHEDIRAAMNVTSARDLITEFQVLLDQWKEDSETNVTHMKNHMATVNEQGEVGNHMARVESYWEDLNKQLEKGSKITSCTIPMLRKIEVVLAKLPKSHRDKLQAKFYGLRAEAETIMGNMIMDCMKIQWDN